MENPRRLFVCFSVLLFSLLLNRSTVCKGGLCSSDQYSYGDALEKAILFFEGQRSGLLPQEQRVTWRGNSALSDGDEDRVDLKGGYYDAGDNVKFGWPMAFTVTLLSWATIEFKSAILVANQFERLLEAIHWGTDFLLKAHVSPDILYTQVGDGNADHQCWERPEDMDTPRTLYKVTPTSPGAEVAAEMAAAFSATSIVFKTINSTYSSTLLNHSISLFEFADKHRGSYNGSCPFYCSISGYLDELLWATTWLYKATMEKKYVKYVMNNKGWSQRVTEFSWDNKFAGTQILLAKDFYGGEEGLVKFKVDAEAFLCALIPRSGMVQIKTTPGGLLFVRDAANLQYVTSSTMLLYVYSKTLSEAGVSGIQCGSMHFSPSQIRTFAKFQVDYILGRNPMEMSYMVGHGNKYPMHIHHRGSSIPSIHQHPSKIGCRAGYTYYYSSNQTNPNLHVGALVGGPDFNDRYNDVRSDPSHSEPTTYMNAAFVGSLSGLIYEIGCGCSFLDLNTSSNLDAYSR